MKAEILSDAMDKLADAEDFILITRNSKHEYDSIHTGMTKYGTLLAVAKKGYDLWIDSLFEEHEDE